MSTGIWAGLAFFCFVVAAGMAWVAYQLLLSWRMLKSLPGGILGQVNDLNRGLAELEQRVARVERQVTDLQANVESLSVSFARARVLMGGVDEVSSMITTARSFIPSK